MLENEKYNIASDGELIEWSLGECVGAYEVLIERHRETLRAFAAKRGVIDVDDLVQETFIRAYLKLQQYNPQFSFAQWICGIARNLHTDLYRRKSQVKTLQIETVHPPEESLNPEQKVISQQSGEVLENSLRKLPSNYSRVLRMRFWDDLSYNEISEKLSLPLGTIKTQIHRGREMLLNEILKQDLK